MAEFGDIAPAAGPRSAAGDASVVVIGDALIDEIHHLGEVQEFVGGAALNVAVGLATLGVSSALIAMVGNDSDGDWIRRYVAERNVKLIASPSPNGTSRGVSRRVDGEPSYEFNTAARSRKIAFGEAERAAIAAAELVVVSCFPFDDGAQVADLEGAITNPQSRLVIDANPRIGMMHDLRAFTEAFERIAPTALLVKVGDDDSTLLYGTTVDAATAHLLSAGSSTVLATAGRHGASVETASGIVATVPISDLPGPIVDTMGAGDATLASVIQSIITSGLPAEAAVWHAVLEEAMLIAGATCRHQGALLRVA